MPTTRPVPVETARRGVGRQRDAKIRDDGLPLEQEDVLGLDVAMHDAACVRVVQRLGHVADDLEGVVDREASLALQPLAQRLAAHEGHYVEEVSPRVPRVEQGHDVRMAQPRRDLDLAKKPVGAYGASELRIEHLDRDLAAVADVVSEIDGRHPAPADLALDPVTAADGGAECGDSLG